MISNKELMKIQAEVLFKQDENNRITDVNEPFTDIDPPLFFIGRTKDGNILRFNKDLSSAVVNVISKEISENPTNVELGKLLSVLSEVRPIHHVWIGPAFAFPKRIEQSSQAIKITEENKGLLFPYFPFTAKLLEWRQPCFAVVQDGIAVSVCCSARRSEKAAEASLNTLEEYEGKGYGTEAATAWAKEVQKAGVIALYSTAWDNFASQAVAKKLNLIQYGVDVHMG